MGIDSKHISETTEDDIPSQNQFLKNRGKSLSPKVFHYDPKSTSLRVGNKNKLDKEGNYQKLSLPPDTTQISLFCDPETNSDIKTECETDDGEGQSYVLLAKLHLDRFGLWNRVLLAAGQISTLYISKPGAVDALASSVRPI